MNETIIPGIHRMPVIRKKEKSPPSTDRLPENIFHSIDSIIGKARNINRLFFSFIKKLNRFLPINRAALVIYSNRDKVLKVIALKGETAREGLALTLPAGNSLLGRVYNSRATYIADTPFFFSGNFFERKVLIGPGTKSVLVTPIITGGKAYGLICLSSTKEFAFENYDSSILDRIFRKLGIAVGDLAPLLNI